MGQKNGAIVITLARKMLKDGVIKGNKPNLVEHHSIKSGRDIPMTR